MIVQVRELEIVRHQQQQALHSAVAAGCIPFAGTYACASSLTLAIGSLAELPSLTLLERG